MILYWSNMQRLLFIPVLVSIYDIHDVHKLGTPYPSLQLPISPSSRTHVSRRGLVSVRDNLVVCKEDWFNLRDDLVLWDWFNFIDNLVLYTAFVVVANRISTILIKKNHHQLRKEQSIPIPLFIRKKKNHQLDWKVNTGNYKEVQLHLTKKYSQRRRIC